MYRKDKIRHGAGSVTWRCSVEQKFKCKSRAKTIGAYIVKQTYPHNHQPKFPWFCTEFCEKYRSDLFINQFFWCIFKYISESSKDLQHRGYLSKPPDGVPNFVGSKLVDDYGYIFGKDGYSKAKEGNVFWRCQSYYKLKCRARAKTINDESVHYSGVHNHDPPNADVSYI